MMPQALDIKWQCDVPVRNDASTKEKSGF